MFETSSSTTVDVTDSLLVSSEVQKADLGYRLNQKHAFLIRPSVDFFIGNSSVKWRRSQFLAALCRLWTVNCAMCRRLSFACPPQPTCTRYTPVRRAIAAVFFSPVNRPRRPAVFVSVRCNGCVEGVAVDWLPLSSIGGEMRRQRAVWREYTSRTAAAVLLSYQCVVKQFKFKPVHTLVCVLCGPPCWKIHYASAPCLSVFHMRVCK